jgi:hypothetical protein
MADDSRILKSPEKNPPYMVNTNALQLSPGVPSTTKKWENFGWTQDESDQWKSFATQANDLFILYTDPDKTSSAIKAKLKVLIKNILAYDHDELTGHHLLDKVALFGTLDDCKTFRVKRGTALAKPPSPASKEPVTKIPQIAIRKYDINLHILDVTDPGTPDSKAKPEGIKFVRVLRYIGTEAPASTDVYKPIGNASRGTITSKLPENETSGSTRKFAWYIACYESETGMLGPYCTPLRLGIVST